MTTDLKPAAVKPGKPGIWSAPQWLRLRSPAECFLLLLIILVMIAPLLPLDPNRQDLGSRLMGPFKVGLDEWQYLLGADSLGRSVIARLLYGAQVSLLVGLCSAALAMIVGSIVGIAAGVWRGKFESFAMRFVDMWMSLPTLLIALVILFVLGPGMWKVVLVLALLRWMVFARVARALTLSITQHQYFEAARAVGCSKPRIIIHHVVPNIKWDLLSLWTLEVALAMLTEAGLSFLGLGIQPPQSSWGTMLSEARDYMSASPWLIVFPGLLILLTTLSINLIVNARRLDRSGGTSVWASLR